MQTTGSANGATSNAKKANDDKSKKPRKKKRSLASALTNAPVAQAGDSTSSSTAFPETEGIVESTSVAGGVVRTTTATEGAISIAGNSTDPSEPTAKKPRKTKSDQEYKDEYEGNKKCIEKALTKLCKANNVAQDANLTIPE